MYIKISDKEIENEVKVLIRKVLKDMITMKWVREVVEDEVKKCVKAILRKKLK